MPTAGQNTTTLSPNLHSYYQKVLLESAESRLKMRQFAAEKVHPKGSGKDYYMLKYGNISENVTPLADGVTPAAEATIADKKYTVTIDGYGDYLTVSDFITLTAIDPVIKSITERMGYAAAKTIDCLLRNELETNATANLQYVGSGNTDDDDIGATEIFKAPDVLKAVRILRGADAPELSDGSFAWVVHPYIGVDLWSDTDEGGVIDLNKYVAGLAEKPLKGEVGKVYGARVVESSNIRAVQNTGLVDVYRTFVMANEALVMTKFNANAVEIKVKPAGSGGFVDPLDQISSVGYKMYVGVKYIGGAFSNHKGASPDLAIQIRGAATAI